MPNQILENKKPSILVIISNPPGWGGKKVIGGGELIEIEIIKKWHSFGVDIETIETDSNPSSQLSAKYKSHIIRFPRVPNTFFFAFVKFIIFLIMSIKITIKMDKKFDYILASNGIFTDIFPAWLISKITGSSFIAKLQLPYPNNFFENYRTMRNERNSFQSFLISFFILFNRSLLKSATKIICLSEAVKREIEFHFHPQRLIVTSGFIKIQEIDSIKSKSKKYDAIYTGRIEKIKGIEDILYSWKKVVKKKPRSKLVLVGDGQFLNDAKKIVEDEGLKNNVIFTGFLKHPKIFEYLKESKIFIHFSRYEGFCLSITEALACGLPVICYRLPVFHDLYKDCKSVFMLDVGDVGKIPDTISNLLKDEKTLNKLSRESKSFVKKFDINSVSKKEFQSLNICKK